MNQDVGPFGQFFDCLAGAGIPRLDQSAFAGFKAKGIAFNVAGSVKNSSLIGYRGEVLADLLGQGYLAGFGMIIGTVFGRIAGGEVVARLSPLVIDTDQGSLGVAAR